ncbi:hypothetical protein KFE25_009379 [Diacronema lutheri]|uniref:N-acetyltransferase domain-containing protein n=1 Tax=Diacronema lutheri TaxID=2081491 RepID=A0A8J5XMJ8_DIALT|nr:hypothetical protein KFE25_009379 [Diacronema lutheri]
MAGAISAIQAALVGAVITGHAPIASRHQVRAASELGEQLAASRLLCDAFSNRSGPAARLGRLSGLRLPGLLEANVFFAPAGPPDIGVVVREGDDDGQTLGVIQLVPARLLGPARACAPAEAAPHTVGWVQNLAVAKAHRRQGCARALMGWCEERACARGITQLWLAAAVEDAGTRALHASCGYSERGSARGNVLMRKELRCSAPAGASIAQPGLSPVALATELGVQLMYCAIAALGISVLLAPFGGETVAQLIGRGGPADLALGCGVSAIWLVLRRDAWLVDAQPATPDASGAAAAAADAALAASVAAQLAPVRRLLREEGRVPVLLAALGAWQLAVACAEELYYRGLLQQAIATAARALGDSAGASGADAGGAAELPAVLCSSALFALVHSAWVDEAGAGSGASGGAAARAVWLRESFCASLVFGALFACSHHVLLAPVTCHALVNAVPLGWREARRARDV